MSGTAGVGNDGLELVDLSLGTAKGSELLTMWLANACSSSFDVCAFGIEKTYSLLGELAGALVARVAEELNDAALVGSEASNLLDDLADESGALAQVALGAGDAGLDDASGGLLYSGKKKVECQRPSSAM